MKKLLILMAIGLLFISCDITKRAVKDKTSTSWDEEIETIRKSKGDSLGVVINNNFTLKDTIARDYGKGGTVIERHYTKEGEIRYIQCNCPEVNESKTEKRSGETDTVHKEKDKKEELNTDWILYVVGGAVLIVAFFMFLMYRTVNKNTQAFNAVLQKLG